VSRQSDALQLDTTHFGRACRYDADPDAEPDVDKGGSPLMHAANGGHAAVVTALLEVCHAAWLRNLHSLGLKKNSLRHTSCTRQASWQPMFRLK